MVEVGALERLGYEALVEDEKLAAVLIIPPRYGRNLLSGKRSKLELVGDTNSTSGMGIESEVLSSAIRLENAVRTGLIMEEVLGERTPFDYILKEALLKWDDPPISVHDTTSSLLPKTDNSRAAMAHTSPGMMLQFAIASLLTAAQIIVTERKSRVLQRMLTTSTARGTILGGHFMAIFTLIGGQFVALILFGQFVLGVSYLRMPLATLLVALSAAVCIAGLGLLIGTVARSQEQAITFSIVPMFVLSGLGGAWVPLEMTGRDFQILGHLSPIAWAMDGFKAVSIRGLGLESVLLPAGALLGYGALFFTLAWRRFRRE
jgi:ABC-2 type transport system permease protein